MFHDIYTQGLQLYKGFIAFSVAAGSYVFEPPPQHLLDLQIFLIDIRDIPYDFSIRDLIFLITSGIGIYMFRRTMKANESNKRRRKSDRDTNEKDQ